MKNSIKSLILALISCLVCLPLGAQTANTPQLLTDSTATGDTLFQPTLHVVVDADAFVVDNEFKSPQVRGYTLPGTWIAPRIAYRPLPAINLELGAYAAFYDGASRYPCYAYSDIVSWKGAQYSRGVHALPWFRADARMGQFMCTLGNLHQHQLSIPLYNPECEFSADPDMGAQICANTPRYKGDLWLNWHSFIFQMDTHQEAFMAGLTQHVQLTRPHQSFALQLPLEVLYHHRGGEIDDTHTGTQTLMNASAGLTADWHLAGRVLTGLHAEARGLFSWQQTGHLWPYNNGYGAWANIGATLWHRLNAQMGYCAGRQFISTYGSPLFSTYGLRSGRAFSRLHTGYYGVNYTQPFGLQMSLSAKVEGYLTSPEPGLTDHSLSVLLCFRARLAFLLCRMGRKS
ncbi:MAG: hypothetical protein MJZ40_05710 [Bacteroidaceae bacterium]|nr:hypothetical protein [Bacteroidaceae bacterium]